MSKLLFGTNVFNLAEIWRAYLLQNVKLMRTLILSSSFCFSIIISYLLCVKYFLSFASLIHFHLLNYGPTKILISEGREDYIKK